MKFADSHNAYIRPRWAQWVGELRDAGLKADALRSDPKERDTAPRADFNEWLAGSQTVSAKKAFSVGRCLAAHPKLRTFGDPVIALYAAGYKAVASASLQTMIDTALEKYPNKVKVAQKGLGDTSAFRVRQLRYALAAIVAIPYAFARVDGLAAKDIPDVVCTARLAEIVALSDPKFFGDTCAQDAPRSAGVDALTRDDEETLAWTALANRISLLAQSDPILQLHFSMMRTLIDDYNRIVYAVPHHRPS